MMTRLRVVSLIAMMVALALPVAADNPPDTVRTVFQIEGMHCGACSSAIQGELEKVEGVVTASADHENGTAEAVYRAKRVEPEDLKTEIEKLGYTVTGMETQPVTG